MQVIKHTNEMQVINHVKQVMRLSKTSMYSPPKSLQNN